MTSAETASSDTGAAAATVVAAWLVEAKKSIVEHLAPVLTAIFTPLFGAGLVGCDCSRLGLGDELFGKATCKAKRALNSKPDVGTVHLLMELHNQRGEAVLNWECHQFLRRRHPGVAA